MSMLSRHEGRGRRRPQHCEGLFTPLLTPMAKVHTAQKRKVNVNLKYSIFKKYKKLRH